MQAVEAASPKDFIPATSTALRREMQLEEEPKADESEIRRTINLFAP